MYSLIKTLKRKVFKPKQKTYEVWAAKQYRTNPDVSFIIQSHNSSNYVKKIVSELRRYPGAEIIVIDDGSKSIHGKRLTKHLTKSNEFVLRANDLYEVITYNRALHMTTAPFACLLQDDDLFSDLHWVSNALEILASHKKLAILGGRDGIRFLPRRSTISGIRGPYKFDGKIGERENSFRFEVHSTNHDTKFRYVQTVNRAPMWINVKLFKSHLKSIDQSYAPFQWDDAELCLRAYRCGLTVGLYNPKFQRCASGEGGMRIWNQQLHQRQDEVNSNKLYKEYGSFIKEVDTLVNQLNSSF